MSCTKTELGLRGNCVLKQPESEEWGIALKTYLNILTNKDSFKIKEIIKSFLSICHLSMLFSL